LLWVGCPPGIRTPICWSRVIGVISFRCGTSSC